MISFITHISDMLHISSKSLKLKKVYELSSDALKSQNLTLYTDLNSETLLLTESNSRIETIPSQAESKIWRPLYTTSEKSYTPILWRKFLSSSIVLSPCQSATSPYCELEHIHISENSRIYSGEILLRRLQINIQNEITTIVFSGSLGIQDELLLTRKDTLVSSSDSLTILIAVFGNMSLPSVKIDDSLSRYDIKLFLHGASDIDIVSLPQHGHCLSKYNPLEIYIVAKSIQIGQDFADLTSYGSCVKKLLPAWYPTKKISGFIRNDP